MKPPLLLALVLVFMGTPAVRAQDDSDKPVTRQAAKAAAAESRGAHQANKPTPGVSQNANPRAQRPGAANISSRDGSSQPRQSSRVLYPNSSGTIDMNRSRTVPRPGRVGAVAPLGSTRDVQLRPDGSRPHHLDLTPEERAARRAANQEQIQRINRNGFADACRRWDRQHHDRNWWRQHCPRIILIGGGYYFWNSGYWYPALGYDLSYSYYPYEGPIYAYNDLPPDQVVSNVQEALQQDGYYDGYIDGELGPQTRVALARYQRDKGLVVTSAIDEPTLASLGML
ncbi:MAG: peptidoglycan-binding protein [Chthoniobacterales bacterium]